MFQVWVGNAKQCFIFSFFVDTEHWYFGWQNCFHNLVNFVIFNSSSLSFLYLTKVWIPLCTSVGRTCTYYYINCIATWYIQTTLTLAWIWTNSPLQFDPTQFWGVLGLHLAERIISRKLTSSIELQYFILLLGASLLKLLSRWSKAILGLILNKPHPFNLISHILKLAKIKIYLVLWCLLSKFVWK